MTVRDLVVSNTTVHGLRLGPGVPAANDCTGGILPSACEYLLGTPLPPGCKRNIKVVELTEDDKMLIRDVATSLKAAAQSNAEVLLGSAIRGSPPGLADNANAVYKSERWREHARLYEMMLALAEACE